MPIERFRGCPNPDSRSNSNSCCSYEFACGDNAGANGRLADSYRHTSDCHAANPFPDTVASAFGSWLDHFNPGATSEPEIRSYVCPWLEFAGDLPTYTYRIIQTYPHDPGAYTQGLIYRDGILYESTGLKGRSSLRIVDLESGNVLQMAQIPDTYFAEGITLFDDKIYQLTWQEQTGFIYEARSLAEIGRFTYNTEGWGLTEDGEILIMSDGTEQLAYIDPDTMGVIRSVMVASGNNAVQRLNELEYIGDEVWANVYQTSCIARIDPKNGNVSGWIDLSGMLSEEEMRIAQVPNGIAYDKDSSRIFVTGKFWPHLFEIEVLPADRK